MASYLEHVSRALGSAFMMGPWTRLALMGLGERVLGERPPWLGGLVSRTLSALPEPPPTVEAVAAVLREHRAFRNAFADQASRPRVRRWLHAPPSAPAEAPWPVPPLRTFDDLARHLELPDEQLSWLADPRGVLRRAPSERLHHYHRAFLPKRAGGHRLVETPKPRLKAVQRRLLRTIFDHIPPHPSAHGFVKGRSPITHAGQHAGRAVVLRLDLEDFFTSVTYARVYRVCRFAAYPDEVARLLAGLCTTSLPPPIWRRAPRPDHPADLPAYQRQRERALRRHLPQGAPTSPSLANHCASRLDRRLHAAAERAGAHYSRYADDLVFSGDDGFARSVTRFIPFAAAIAMDEGFVVNFRKTRVMPRNRRQQVAGLVVNAHPNVSRQTYDRLKAILTNCARHGPASQNRDGHPDFRSHLRGLIAWIDSVAPKRGAELRALFEVIEWKG
ncbi:MAG: reverse transcriptase family protein [Polyangiaceae bacterium]